MESINKRESTRSKAWQNTVATIKMADISSIISRKSIYIKGNVDNIGSSGMFLRTTEFIPNHAKADILINFDPDLKTKDYLLNASGETIRLAKNGVGIKFTSIDISKLQQCIINKINNSPINREVYIQETLL